MNFLVGMQIYVSIDTISGVITGESGVVLTIIALCMLVRAARRHSLACSYPTMPRRDANTSTAPTAQTTVASVAGINRVWCRISGCEDSEVVELHQSRDG